MSARSSWLRACIAAAALAPAATGCTALFPVIEAGKPPTTPVTSLHGALALAPGQIVIATLSPSRHTVSGTLVGVVRRDTAEYREALRRSSGPGTPGGLGFQPGDTIGIQRVRAFGGYSRALFDGADEDALAVRELPDGDCGEVALADIRSVTRPDGSSLDRKALRKALGASRFQSPHQLVLCTGRDSVAVPFESLLDVRVVTKQNYARALGRGLLVDAAFLGLSAAILAASMRSAGWD